MLRDPLVAKKFLQTTCWSKNNLQKPEKKTPLEPLDLLATVGQSRVCVCVYVCLCVSVCVCEERRCGVVTLKSPKITHFSLTYYLSLYQQQTNYLFVTFVSYKKPQNERFFYIYSMNNFLVTIIHRITP